jgi:hypothetical protein
MMRLEKGVKALEEKTRVAEPLIIIIHNALRDLSPEEVALFKADEERQIKEAEKNRFSGVLCLDRSLERLAALKEANLPYREPLRGQSRSD